MPREVTDRTHTRAVLGATDLFGGLDAGTLDALVDALDIARVHGGERLFAQGDAGDAAYLVLSGRLRVERADGDRTTVIREVGRGELVGELSLLTGAPRSATVRAVRDTELGRLPRERFDPLLQAHAPLAIEITRMLAGWIAAPPAASPPGASVATIAVRGLGREPPTEAVAQMLASALAVFGTTALIAPGSVDARLGVGAAAAGPGDPRHDAAARWLDEQERAHDYVVYVGDADAPGWTARCIRQSDLILTVAQAGDPPVPPTERSDGASAHWSAEDLVLVHADGARTGRGTAHWLAGRTIRCRHHVRLRDVEDFARLARRLTGRGIGVALSGGGARGLAHIGFLRALEETGIPVDEIGGTSMGAVIAAQYAAGMPLDEIVARNTHGWQHHHPHRAYTIPFASIVTHRAAQRMLEEMFGDLDYEDCWIEAFACSASLTRSRLVVHRTGRVARGTLASIAIPGVAPPIVGEDGDLLVDGGVLNNLPAALLSRGAHGAVLASDASPGMQPRSGYAATPSNWRVLRDRWTRRTSAPYYPSIFETLARVAVVASTQETRRVRDTADLYFHAPVDHIGIFEFHRLTEVAEIGYRAALGPVRDWWADRSAGARRRRRSTISGV
jgi:predicted acylesterase/phospholipase RssA